MNVNYKLSDCDILIKHYTMIIATFFKSSYYVVSVGAYYVSVYESCAKILITFSYYSLQSSRLKNKLINTDIFLNRCFSVCQNFIIKRSQVYVFSQVIMNKRRRLFFCKNFTLIIFSGIYLYTCHFSSYFSSFLLTAKTEWLGNKFRTLCTIVRR